MRPSPGALTSIHKGRTHPTCLEALHFNKRNFSLYERAIICDAIIAHEHAQSPDPPAIRIPSRGLIYFSYNDFYPVSLVETVFKGQ